MSFAREVSAELSRVAVKTRHCRIAELAAIVTLCGSFDRERGLTIRTDWNDCCSVAVDLIRKLFDYECELEDVQIQGGKVTHIISVSDGNVVANLLGAVKAEADANGRFCAGSQAFSRSCCKRAFIRGAYITAGSMSDPEKGYHFEIDTDSKKAVKVISEAIGAFDIEAKTVIRKNRYVIYIKDGDSIVDLLNVMEAHVALMKLENIRILKEMRNSVNKRVNCEAANINKTVVAASRQIDCINLIISKGRFDELTDELKDVALVRLDNPEASLEELGTMLEKRVGKSGVNHRLKKLISIAESIEGNGAIE